jgi:hypothetical protein
MKAPAVPVSHFRPARGSSSCRDGHAAGKAVTFNDLALVGCKLRRNPVLRHLNRLPLASRDVQRGLHVGLICNRGFEQVHSTGRAIQSYLGYALEEERIHLNTHRYDKPLAGTEQEPTTAQLACGRRTE